MFECIDRWPRIHDHKDLKGMVKPVVTIICWNIWSEWNNNLFNNTSHSTNWCIISTYHDITHWAGKFSDRERVCNSEDDDNYLLDNSPVVEGHQSEVFGKEE